MPLDQILFKYIAAKPELNYLPAPKVSINRYGPNTL
jgi:hypothetical protein